MIFTNTKIDNIEYVQPKDEQEKRSVREFFKKYYKHVALDVFPNEEHEPFYNPLLIKGTDASGKIVGSLFSCTPPLLAKKTFENPSQANLNRTKRLTFLELVSSENNDKGIQVQLLNLLVETSKNNGVKSIVGFVSTDNPLTSSLSSAGFNLLHPNEPLPPLQGIRWELPPDENSATTIWFYKML